MQTSLFLRTLPSLRHSAVRSNVRYLASKAPPPPPPNSGGSKPSKKLKPAVAEKTKATENLETGAERAEAMSSPTSLSLDFSPAEEGGQAERDTTGARSSEGSLSSIERRRRFMSRATLAAMGLGLVATAVYLGREWDEDELKSKKLVSMDSRYVAVRARTYGQYILQKDQDVSSTRFGRTKMRFSGLFDVCSSCTIT